MASLDVEKEFEDVRKLIFPPLLQAKQIAENQRLENIKPLAMHKTQRAILQAAPPLRTHFSMFT